MLNRIKTSKRSEGFTIIEIMIVLAVAALILLIVLLAVPALQRSSRNTQRKNDVSTIAGAISEWESNNDGALPTNSGAFDTEFTGENPNLGYYDGTSTSSVDYTYETTAPTTVPTNTSTEIVKIYNYVTCTANNATTSGATSRSVAILYAIETSGGTTQQCVAD